MAQRAEVNAMLDAYEATLKEHLREIRRVRKENLTPNTATQMIYSDCRAAVEQLNVVIRGARASLVGPTQAEVVKHLMTCDRQPHSH